MFAQVVSTKRPDGRTYRYMHIVESYREGKTVKKRRIASLGNIDNYSEQEIEQFIRTLESLLQNRTSGSIEDFDPKSTLSFGVPYVVQFLWDQLGLTKAIETGLKDRQVTFDVARYVKAMVCNRLMNPSSKLDLFHTIEDMYLPEEEGESWQLQHFYRALDHLMDMKPELETFIYQRLTDLLNFRLSLVLYDLTSTHLSGHHCPIGKHGYSRTHRPDLEQVELGLLVTPDGLPITHEVFAGNTPDKKTVKEVLERLKKDFSVEQCVFVGDRGMVTKKNTELLAALEYPYIVGYHKRGRVVSDTLLAQYGDLSLYTELRGNLSYLEVPASAVEDDEKGQDARYILCYNPLKAKADEAFRTSALEEAEQALVDYQTWLDKPHRGRKASTQSIMLKVSDILTKKGVQGFLEVEFSEQKLSYTWNEAALAKEALRDGKFVIKTNTLLPAEQVVTSYKTLMNVERAFREIKNFLDVGPVYHWNEKRVRGHIFVCVLAYLFEQEIQVMYRRGWAQQEQEAEQMTNADEREQRLEELNDRWYTGERIMKDLSRWHVMKAEFLGKEFLSVPPPPQNLSEVLKALGIPLPAKAIQLRNTSSGTLV
ncbi:IS1634 family transposase [Alicyclobacillus sp. SO9]|uniref:IS1634 family transposase n=1 Tax=Alicyclobacillus sp. SO9 TaxID=2665646 RepID=UPI0018E7A72F|nr:IS1634 family transposase [Alicyclobacillus sp. SO9]QQE78184.1 IS1634 family transposase [Alicyclobacillus sp. SO9]QQE78420.1 IS1634 family transposase [Alicyclobacillus sp. SO9]QQE79206.1 IS1634 family transposase [Alicyclobacillus sp. SO9]QQE79331.1 IS1634 family transposase [Alicyclobacillus sp. SO9]QQE81537.1 IS1634 family transposase [Alicyclobacillus sp. SO9]